VKYVVIALALAVAASVATYARYRSLIPCDWLESDMMRETGLPRLVAQARISAAFLLDGITEPDPGQCLRAWWELKAEGAAARQ